MAETVKKPADYILPLYMNGLQGRMLRIPPKRGKKREILFIYGHHSSLERVYGVAEYLNKYGGVTIPDLPGFGGMQSFYKIGEEPTLDNMADYLAAFIKLRYRNKRLTMAGTSLGFMIVTRMLQKYPELAKKIDLLVSMAGFTNKKDFIFKRSTFLLFRSAAPFLSGRIMSSFIRHILFRKIFIRFAYRLVESKHSKLRQHGKQARRERIDFEINLWQSNDVRTYMKMGETMLNLNLRGKHIDLPVYHVSIANDRYFDNVRVEQHMREIYKDFHHLWAHVPAHSPSVVATAKEAEPYIPITLRRLLK
ncbi:alpha/beta hydrolase [Candidatus Saccharibacteria bacterium]|nr:alpha/beta hydrolase [Candidatus Saccharibacteria bacterium]